MLQERGINPKIIEYLNVPPTVLEIKTVLKKLGIGARDLLRKGEDDYKELGLANADLEESSLIEAMVERPRLIERPVVVCGDKAVLGRPPENVLALLDQ